MRHLVAAAAVLLTLTAPASGAGRSSRRVLAKTDKNRPAHKAHGGGGGKHDPNHWMHVPGGRPPEPEPAAHAAVSQAAVVQALSAASKGGKQGASKAAEHAGHDEFVVEPPPSDNSWHAAAVAATVPATTTHAATAAAATTMEAMTAGHDAWSGGGTVASDGGGHHGKVQHGKAGKSKGSGIADEMHHLHGVKKGGKGGKDEAVVEGDMAEHAGSWSAGSSKAEKGGQMSVQTKGSGGTKSGKGAKDPVVYEGKAEKGAFEYVIKEPAHDAWGAKPKSGKHDEGAEEDAGAGSWWGGGAAKSGKASNSTETDPTEVPATATTAAPVTTAGATDATEAPGGGNATEAPDAGGTSAAPDELTTPATESSGTTGAPATEAPVTEAPATEAADSADGAGQRSEKWYPSESDDGSRFCEYGSDYPEEYTNEVLASTLLFDDKDDCCDAFPAACPPTPPPVEEEELLRAPRIDLLTVVPTYAPTQLVGETLPAASGETVVAVEPFGLRYLTTKPEPNVDAIVVTEVTREHLVHSFRTKEWEVEQLDLMILEKEDGGGRRLDGRALAANPAYELVFGGVMYFPPGKTTPTVSDMNDVIDKSFAGDRLSYYVTLLREAGMDISDVILDAHLDGSTSYSKGDPAGSAGMAGWMVALVATVSSVAFLGLASAALVFYRRNVRPGGGALRPDQYAPYGPRLELVVTRLRRARFEAARRFAAVTSGLSAGRRGGAELDLEGGNHKDMAIRLKRSDDEVDQPTVAGSMDQMSVPSTVGRGAGRPAASGDSLDEVHSAPSLPSVGDVSPLESPTGTGSSPGAPAPATRYVSVFTVKKDCGGRSLEEVDLRALAIAYLSRMLKKFPNTHLLPYDRRSGLPRIVNIRDIPDGIDELANYVGEARVDQRTGKVLFNLRVESDEPVSKMKSSGSGGTSRPSGPRGREPEGGRRRNTARPTKPMNAPRTPGTPGSSNMEDVAL